jgi:hypothetical protein
MKRRVVLVAIVSDGCSLDMLLVMLLLIRAGKSCVRFGCRNMKSSWLPKMGNQLIKATTNRDHTYITLESSSTRAKPR